MLGEQPPAAAGARTSTATLARPDRNRPPWPSPGRRSGADRRDRSRALVGLLAAGCAVVPWLFTTRLDDVFTVPKLAALWLLLIGGLVLVGARALLDAPVGAPIRWLPAVDAAVISFLVLNLIAAARSTDRQQSLFGERLQNQGLLTTLLYLGLFLLARHAVTDVRALTLVFSGITAGATVVAGYAILQKTGVDPVWRGLLPEGRVFSTIGQSNALAAYLVVALAPTVYLLRLARGAVQALLVLAAAAIVAALLLTLSRGGVLGLLVAAAVPVGCIRSKKLLAGLVAGLLVATAASITFFPPVGRAVTGAWTAITTRGGGEGQLSIDNHVDLWEIAARITLDHPLTGTGQETFPDVFPRYSHALLPAERSAYFGAFRVESAHNVFLTTSANTGIPALVAYLWLVLGFVAVVLGVARGGLEEAHRLAFLAILAAVAGHLTTDLFMTADITSTWLFWTLLGAGLGARPPSVASGGRS